jgi:DnaK suppressor protein
LPNINAAATGCGQGDQGEGEGVMKKTIRDVARDKRPPSRYIDLKVMLDDRRRQIHAEVQGKMRDVRADGGWGGKLTDVLDEAESSDADIQGELEIALLEMKSQTLHQINDALTRLERGAYGNCFECGEDIAEKRLRALPFAVRCKDCEEAREIVERRQRQLVAWHANASSLLFDV